MEKETPRHLKNLEDVIEKYAYFNAEVDHAEYTEIAFLLLEAYDGDKEAQKKVADFIKGNYETEKRLRNDLKNLATKIKDWLAWATNWTTYNPEGKK